MIIVVAFAFFCEVSVMKIPKRTITAVLFAAIVGASAMGVEAKPPATPTDRGASPKNEACCVVQVGEDVKAIRKSELKSLQKSSNDQYQKDLKAFQESKKSGNKGNDNAEPLKKPEKSHYTVKMLKSSFKNLQEAEEWKIKYLENKKDGGKTNKKPSAW